MSFCFLLQMLEGGGHLPYAELLGDHETFPKTLDREALPISLGELLAWHQGRAFVPMASLPKLSLNQPKSQALPDNSY